MPFARDGEVCDGSWRSTPLTANDPPEKAPLMHSWALPLSQQQHWQPIYLFTGVFSWSEAWPWGASDGDSESLG